MSQEVHAARRARPAVAAAIGLLAIVAAGCAPKGFAIPSGPAASLPGFAEAASRATAACRGVNTFTVELSLSGRAGGRRLRGRLIAGLARPDSIRLEGLAPFGPPAFVLAAHPGSSVLLLPRDRRVLLDAPASEIVEALAGVELGADDLRAILTGCAAPQPQPIAGRVYGATSAIDLEGGATLYLRQLQGELRTVAATRGSLVVEYTEYASDFPRRVRLRSMEGTTRQGRGPQADLTVELRDLQVNVPLDPEAFAVDVPADAIPMTLEELRAAGPLGERP